MRVHTHTATGVGDLLSFTAAHLLLRIATVGRASAVMGDFDETIIPRACQILSVFKHCRDSSQALQLCQQRRQNCESERSKFIFCAEASSEQVVRDLMRISAAKCPREVAAFERCKRDKGGDAMCEAEDLNVLQWRDTRAPVSVAAGLACDTTSCSGHASAIACNS
jgi:hypothetical protein